MTNFKKYTLGFTFIIILGILTFSFNSSEENVNENALKIRTTNEKLKKGFHWATEKAISYVQTGKHGLINISEHQDTSKVVKYIPSYWAGYPGRSAFYSRDFCHQANGAHLLGLEKENFSMLKAFASSADVKRKFFPLWALNFDGSPFNLDYRNDENFVREVPAVFELVETGYNLFQWTGDDRYIQDEILWNYYSRAVNEFIELHDNQIPNGVAEGTGKGIFEGATSYNEQRDAPLIESGDAIASQYKAFLAYAKMANHKGDKDLAQDFFNKASELKSYFNNYWGVKNNNSDYNRGYLRNQEPVAGWGKENSWFLPLKGIVDSNSERTENYLSFINDQLNSKEDMPDNIEALSYIPEIYFLHYKNEIAWDWMKYILTQLDKEHITAGLTGENGDYPEISYVLIGNIVEGLMGIRPQAINNKIITLSHLPDELQHLGVDNINFNNSSLSVTHYGNHSTTLKYDKGHESFKWEAQFPGQFDYVWVNGVKEEADQKIENGITFTYFVKKLNKGDEVSITINSDKSYNLN